MVIVSETDKGEMNFKERPRRRAFSDECARLRRMVQSANSTETRLKVRYVDFGSSGVGRNGANHLRRQPGCQQVRWKPVAHLRRLVLRIQADT